MTPLLGGEIGFSGVTKSSQQYRGGWGGRRSSGFLKCKKESAGSFLSGSTNFQARTYMEFSCFEIPHNKKSSTFFS